ncbi:hypothetical protein [Dyadobacter sp. CY356]|uniref:hypothetical protein n=1 Tax=Dyadobacter sp. CY356 TaxID=2906442 RepID=UPI001F24250E|nr:hypothetical protein [Dyadobacter sp. CY356]MCF0055558.1 hypothetical protein [Dyadobacter sp. CY356]
MAKKDYLKHEFSQNKNELEPEHGRKPWREPNTELEPDPYQIELDKIEQRIKDAKALSDRDIQQIEKSLAHQDIHKDISRSQTNNLSEEALKQQKLTTEREEKKRAFMAAFKSKDKNRDHER